MLQSLKKSKLYIAITLLVQAISFVTLFIILYSKNKKSIASAFLALAGVGAAFGGYLLYLNGREEKDEDDYTEYLDRVIGEDLSGMEDLDDDDLRDFEIPVDDIADETEFS